jgi:RHS repeat-associated protein
VSNDYGSLEDRYEYDAFGKPYKGDLESGMNLGYTGKPYDAATGLYNYGYRDYKPEAARWTTVDPIRDGANWFSYVNGDPVNWVDRWGLAGSFPDGSREQDIQWANSTKGDETARLLTRVKMGEFGISNDGPCIAMSYLGIAQSYAKKNLTPAQVTQLINNDTRVYDNVAGAKISAIEIALKVLKVDTSKLNITDERVSKQADPFASATIRGIPTSNSIYNDTHYQEGTNTGELKWDPLIGTKDNGEEFTEIRNIYITTIGKGK